MSHLSSSCRRASVLLKRSSGSLIVSKRSTFASLSQFKNSNHRSSSHHRYATPLHHSSHRNIVTVVRQYERAVVLTFGRLTSVKEPGLRIFVNAVQNLYKVDLRTRVQELPPQQIITRDNVSASVNAVIYFHVTNAADAVLKVDDVDLAVIQAGQTELRDVLCQGTFNELLQNRDTYSKIVAKKMQERCEPWGVTIEILQLKNVDLVSDEMIRAMAKEAEASREKTAAYIRADGELLAAEKLVKAAKELATTNIGLELRRLQTIERIGSESSQRTVIIPDSVMEDPEALFSAAIAGGLSGGSEAAKLNHLLDFDGESGGIDDDFKFKFQ